MQLTFSEIVTLAGLLGGGAWFAVDAFSAYQNWRANDIQERQLAAFEEANDLTRQQAMTGGRVMLHRAPRIPMRSVVRQFPLWRVLPPIALFLLALGVSGYDLYKNHLASVHPATVSSSDRPLADDAVKWQLQEAIERDLRVPAAISNKPNPSQCQVVIVHDADTYVRHFADDLAAVITSSGGNAYVQPHAIDLPQEGIRVFAPKGKQFDCATRFTTRLGMILGPIDPRYANLMPDHADKLTPAMSAFGELGNCYEIDIGPRPGS